MDEEKIVDAILGRISSKGDLAAALLGFVLGFVLDVKFPIPGIRNGTAGALGMIAATGFKVGAQALWDHFRSAARLRKGDQRRRDELERDARTIEELDIGKEPLLHSALNRLRSDRELWQKQLISDQDFQGTITNFVDRYRRFQEDLPTSAALDRQISTHDL